MSALLAVIVVPVLAFITVLIFVRRFGTSGIYYGLFAGAIVVFLLEWILLRRRGR